MKKEIIAVVLTVLLLLGLGFWVKNQKNEPKIEKNIIKPQKILKIGQIVLNVEIADINAEREQGLSGKAGLGENEGMLFVFDEEGYYSFWMKDMNFPIDIVWLDKDKKIIYVEKSVSPETYPKTFYAQKADLPILSLYVLEIPAGFLVKNNIKIGDLVAF